MKFFLLVILSLFACPVWSSEAMAEGWKVVMVYLNKDGESDPTFKCGNGDPIIFDNKKDKTDAEIRAILKGIFNAAEKVELPSQGGKIYPKIVLELRCGDKVPFECVRRVLCAATVVTDGVGNQAIFKSFFITIGKNGGPVGSPEETALNAEIWFRDK